MSVVLPPPPGQYDPRDQAVFRDEMIRTVLRLETAIDDAAVRPRILDAVVSFNDQGQALLNLRCNADTLSLRYAVSGDAAPTYETVQAADVQRGSSYDVTLEGPYSVGSVLYLAVIPYAGPEGDGRAGDVFRLSATRGDPFYAECRAVIVGSSPTTITVEASGLSRTGTAAVRLADADGLTIVSGLAVDTPGVSPQRWVFLRPAEGTPAGTPRFTATFPDAVDDSDLCSVPPIGFSPLYFLGVRARVFQVLDEKLIVRVAVADPFPQGADSVTLSATVTGDAVLTPSLPLTLTPTAAFSGVDGAYVDLEITRPELFAADAEIVFRVTSALAARVDDFDVLDVLARTRAVPWLEISRALTPDDATITWDGGPLVEYSTDGGVTFTTPPASPFTVERPDSALGFDLVYTFRATGADNGLTIYQQQDVVIPRKSPDYLSGILVTTLDAPGDGGGSFEISFTEGVPGPTDIVYEATYSITDGGTGTSFVTDQVATGSASPIVVATPLGDDAGASPIGGVVVLRAKYEDTVLDTTTYDGLFAT